MATIQKIQQLNAQVMPPGASPAFRDWLVRLGGVTTTTGEVATGAEQVAAEAKQIADAQRVRNDNQDVTLALHAQRLSAVEGRVDTLEGDVEYLLGEVADLETRAAALEAWRVYMTRQKAEVVYSGISLNIPTTPSNLLTLLGTLTPTSGSLSPFFNTTTGKMTALAKDLDLKFKLSIRGTFAGGSANRSMQLTFNIATPDTLVISRNDATTIDDLLFSTWFGVDDDGELATDGTTITIQANGSAFTATQIKLLASQ